MRGVSAGRGTRRVLAAFVVAVASSWLAPDARALEAAEGRIQLHGFVEAQVRGLSRNYSEEFDLVQWYNVLNLELEVDILPDGWGPVDLLEAFVRVEARYDCVWSRGCGTMRSANTYGNRSKRLPGRLRDAKDPDYSGVIPPTPPNRPVNRIQDKRPAPLAPLSRAPETKGVFGLRDNVTTLDRQGFPGFDTLFEQKGADNILGTADDPAVYTFGPAIDYRWALLDQPQSALATIGTLPVGPWDPKSFIQANALLIEKGNPFRGGSGYFGAFEDSLFILGAGTLPFIGGYRGLDPLDPFLADLQSDLFQASDEGVLIGKDGDVDPLGTAPSLVDIRPDDLSGEAFAGDFNGILPCADPTSPEATKVKAGLEAPLGCVANIPVDPVTGDFLSMPDGGVVEDGLNISLLTGTGELPMRPGPDLSNLTPLDPDDLAFDKFNELEPKQQLAVEAWFTAQGNPLTREELAALNSDDDDVREAQAAELRTEWGFPGNNSKRLYAQGLFIPSLGLRRELAAGLDPETGVPIFDAKTGKPKTRNNLDHLDFNYRESERAWNRGQSQQDTKELKEAYLDIEWLDSRLWTRVGLQTIVWGKTELFRTTDQFNPQDLALASLPSLEESRIALWAARMVYSLYNVGPLEDVRLELAMNFDNFQPADLGAAGEPFTPDLVGALTTGLFFHGMTGIGVAGIDRPENPWDSVKGLEVGGRVEWRWDRFSFALTDFYGYNDFPFIDRIFTYERNVALATGRPLITEVASISECDTPFEGTYTNLGEAGGQMGDAPARTFADPQNPASMTPYGIGTNHDCLKGGGAPGFENENLAGGAQNALAFHHANQQLFAWICSATIAIAAVLDQGACAWNIFGSPREITKPQSGLVPPTFIEVLSASFAGELGQANQGFLRLITNQTKTGTSDAPNTDFSAVNLSFPLAPLNRDPGPDEPNDYWDGVITAGHRSINAQNGDVQPYRVTILDSLPGLIPDFSFEWRPEAAGFDCNNVNSANIGSENLRGPLGLLNPPDAKIVIPGGVCQQFRFHHDDADFVTLDSTLSNAQRALLGCGPFYGTRCDSGDEVWVLPEFEYGTREEAQAAVELLFTEGGGVDFLNMEGSALIQSWPGFEGTEALGETADADVFWTTVGQKAQPGTVGYEGGPVCTRPAGSGDDLVLVTLPGCRGIAAISVLDLEDDAAKRIEVVFEEGYLPSIDGCLVQESFDDGTVGGVPVVYPDVQPGSRLAQELEACVVFSEHKEGAYNVQSFYVPGAATMFHPLAGCLPDTPEQQASFAPGTPLASEAVLGGNVVGTDCDWTDRDYEREFLGLGIGEAEGRTAQVFRSELASFSWNFMLFLVSTSCNFRDGDDIGGNQECFNPKEPLRADKCSFNAPHLCENVKGFLTVNGVARNDVRAGGNERFGRRNFLWHSGGEIVLRYQKRNVFGFSMDFAEDMTKSNWGMEFTWMEGVHFINNDSFANTSRSDTLNLTVSVDRPTFINFLNPNRTFFINSQWFFQYITDYKNGYTSNGPVNVLFTVAVFTGYFQDRLNPLFISVYDFNSQSGGFLPSIQYRFTEAFSAQIGINWFYGRSQRNRMPINEIAPNSIRAPNAKGNNAYIDPVDNFIAVVRSRDEAYLRIRWTF